LALPTGPRSCIGEGNMNPIEWRKLAPGLPVSLATAKCCDTCKHCRCLTPYDDPVYPFCWLGAEIPNVPEPPEDKFPDHFHWSEGRHYEREGFATTPGFVCDHWEGA
jgi:hypothetical protein